MTEPLTCPGCGAVASPDASRCDFCQAALVKIACPSCFGALFEGMRFCPHCGTRAARDAADATPLNCPGCSARMHSVRLGSVTLHECPLCVSCWTSTDTFLQLCTNREERGTIAASIGVQAHAQGKRQFTGVRYVKCPICTKIMNRVNFGRRSGVIVDVCSGHGVWFEHQELRLVLEFIDTGGFERARELDEQQQEEERRATEWKLREVARYRAQASGGQLPLESFLEKPGPNSDSPLAQILAKLLT
jgi:Zn-finger nucleic acid-binding protein